MSQKRPRTGNEPKLETRARRRLELKELRYENEKLKLERDQFLDKIRELESEVQSKDPDSVEERKIRIQNDLLRTELEIHKMLMTDFAHLLREAPEQVNAEHALLKEGADSAHNLVLGLFSQSQNKWKPLKPPPRLDLGVKGCQLSYLFENELFGEKSGAESRLNIRADCTVAKARMREVSDTLWNWFCNHQTMTKMYQLDEGQLELKSLKGSDSEDDIKVVRFRRKFEKKELDQDVVFICNRRRQSLAKSTLSPPNPKGTGVSEFGKVNAIIVSAMSTSIYCNLGQSELEPDIMKVIKGGILFQEGDGVRLSVLYSIPEKFRVGIKDRLCGAIVTEKGRMTKGLATALQSTTQMFAALVKEIQVGEGSDTTQD
mmetsp:Transcript_6517/g.7892  ORF Transcript_6517/g.7892 Transcript_6517/m.7892 type:complete len:374 (-) Transcript_6517:269-1390(-)